MISLHEKTGSSSKRLRLYGICFLLILCTASAFWNIDTCGFTDFDDYEYVCKNYHLFSGFTSTSLAWAFTTFHAANWHPLTWLSFILDFQLYGLKPAGYHLTNLVLHILNTLLLFFGVRLLTGAFWRSALVAALFGLHPLHVESVAWISERKDVLCTFFMLIALIFYTSFARRKNKGPYFASLFLYCLGLLSKPMIVTFPFVLLLCDFWPLKRLFSSENQTLAQKTQTLKNLNIIVLLEKIPFFVLSFASCIMTVLAQHAAIIKTDELALSVRFANALLSYTGYIEKMFWPKNLSFFYPIPTNMPPAMSIAIAAAVLSLISFLVLFRFHKQPYLLFGWLWYLGTLVPVIGIVQVGSQAMADRYTYTPLIGLFVIIAWLLFDCTKKRLFLKVAAIAGSLAMIVLLLFQSRIQAGYWKNDLTLADHAIANSGHNFLAYSTKGHFLLNAHEYDQALRCLATSLAICSTQIAPKINIGCILFNQGKTRESIDVFKQVLAQDSNYVVALVDCGISCAKLGDTRAALDYFTRAAALDSCFVSALFNLGKLYGEMGDYQKSIRYLLRASAINPYDAETFRCLGNSCLKNNRKQEAVRWFEKSISLDPDFIFAHRQLAAALDSCGRHFQGQKHAAIADSLSALWNVKMKK